MAEKAEKKHEGSGAAAAEKKGETPKPAPGATTAGRAAGGGLLAKTPVLLGGVMILEAVVLFAGFKFLGGGHPVAAAGAELTTEEAVEPPKAESGEKGKETAAPV